MERALGVSFENCHRKHLAVVWSKMGVHWQNWSWWPSHQTNWTCCGPVLPLVQTCITCFFLDTCHTFIQNKSSSNLEPKHTLLPVSCQHFWPSISFYLMLIFLFSRPPHLILLSILANPIFIFNSKISSYNPIFFLFFTELLNPWLPVVPSFVLNLCLQKHSRKGWTWSVKKKMWIVITRYGKMICSEKGWK